MKNNLVFKCIIALIIFLILISSNIIYVKATNDSLYVEYEYEEENNQVIVKVNSEIELKATKPTWQLSDDKKIYTKVFGENKDYNTLFENIDGEIIDVNIKITEVKPATIKMEYEYIEETNQVMAKIVSNTQLKHTKPSWKLSEDKKIYTKLFANNTSYSTPVEDINGNIITAEIDVTQVKKSNIRTEYEIDYKNGQIICNIISDIPLKNTKPTWKLSDDKKIYSKTYTTAEKYTTSVEDASGNILNVEINVKIPKASIKVENNYDKLTNQVMLNIISDIPLKNTKPTWSLSTDKLTYTKVFTTNQKYSTKIEDVFGNKIDVNLDINSIDMLPPEIKLEYKYNDDDTVTVYLKSNEELGETKPTWTLSSDKMTYECTFDTDKNYTTSVKDVHGFETNVKIQFRTRKFTYKQNDGSTIIVRYLYKDKKEAIVEVISTVAMKNTKPTWKLSDDGYRYTKIFTDNNMYSTTIEDINGNVKDVNIIVNLFENYLLGIDVSKHNGKINWEEVKNAGIDYAIIRCGYGQDIVSQDDAMFEYNISECERLGIPYGVYIYSYALDLENALSEAEHVLRLIKGHNPEFGIWYDIEDADGYKMNNGMPSNEMFTEIAIAFCERIKENGYNNVGIYASLDWFNNKLNSSKLDIYQKWVAQWNDSCTYNKPYKMWQYSSTGSVNGIKGNVDMNIFYK